MALNFDDNIYSEFSERLQNPYSNFAIQLRLKKKAQEDAIGEYYNKLNDSLNPAGVRYKDMPGFQKRVEALKTYTIQNRDLLKRGDIAAQLERERIFRDAQKFIEGSKDAATGEKEALGLMEKFRGEDKNLEPIFQHVQANELPLEAEGFKRFEPNQFLREAKPFDENVYFQKFDKTPRISNFKMGKVDPKTGYRIDTEIKSFSPEIKEGLATQFAQDYHDKWSFNDRVRNLLEDPREKRNLSDFFADQFGRRPETNEDYAAAYGLRRLQPTITDDGKPVIDPVWMEQYKAGLRRSEKEWEKKLDAATEEQKSVWIPEYINDQSQKSRFDLNGKKKPVSVLKGANGTTYAGHQIPISATIAKGLSKGNKIPDKLFVTTDDKFQPIYYERDKDGKIIKDDDGNPEINESLSVPQDFNSIVIDFSSQFGVKQKNAEGASLMGHKPETKKTSVVSSSKGSTKPAATKDEWLAAGWTEAQIKQAQKDGKIIVK